MDRTGAIHARSSVPPEEDMRAPDSVRQRDIGALAAVRRERYLPKADVWSDNRMRTQVWLARRGGLDRSSARYQCKVERSAGGRYASAFRRGTSKVFN